MKDKVFKTLWQDYGRPRGPVNHSAQVLRGCYTRNIS